MIGNRAGAAKIPHLTVTNSIFNAGPYPIWSTGGTTNCAAADGPLITFNSCFSPYFFSGNRRVRTYQKLPLGIVARRETIVPAARLQLDS